MTASGIYLSNLRIRNAWDGLMSDGMHNVGRLNIENVFMAGIEHIGCYVSPTLDVPRLNNIEIWNHRITGRALDSGIGFHLVHNDMIRMTDCFVFSMAKGFVFEQIPRTSGGIQLHGMTWAVLNGCSADACQFGIEVIGDHDLSISGGLFWSHWGGMVVKRGSPMIRISGSELKANGGPALTVEAESGGHVAVSGCSLFHPLEGYNTPAVRLEGGDVVMSGNYILSSDAGISIGEGIGSAVITGNTSRVRTEPVRVAEGANREGLVLEHNLELPYKERDIGE